MTPEQAAAIRPGAVVFYREAGEHYVVGSVTSRAIAAPLFHLEAIGREDTVGDPGRVSWRLCDLPQPGHPLQAAYRGGPRYSARTLRVQGQPVHPLPSDLLTTEQVAAELGISRRRVQALIRGTKGSAPRLPAQQIGHAFVVRRGDIDQVRDRPVGRPRTRPV